MFDFGNSNNGQKEAISSANGPVLITAGPGTGKTYTLVQRAIYLIEECGVQPENLFIATFTEKAAKELITRITNELARRNITANVNEMYSWYVSFALPSHFERESGIHKIKEKLSSFGCV